MADDIFAERAGAESTPNEGGVVFVGVGMAKHVQKNVGGSGPFGPDRATAGAAGAGAQMYQPEVRVVTEEITGIRQPVRHIKIFTL